MTLTADQLAARRIGSSDAAVALGWSPWEDAYAWWLKRTGRSDPTPESIPMRVGTILEPLVGELFTESTGLAICRVDQVEGPRDYMTANLDFALADHAPLVPVECKAVNAFSSDKWGDSGSEDPNDVPAHYLAQLHHQMICTGADHGYLAALIGNSDFRWYRLALIPELGDALIEAERILWQHVIDDDPPLPTSLSSQRLAWPQHSEREVVEADDEMRAWIASMAEAAAQENEAKARRDALKVLVQGRMKTAEAVVSEGKTLASWRTDKRGSRAFRLSQR